MLGFRTWLLPLEHGARMVVGRNKRSKQKKNMHVKTCFFSKGVNRTISKMVRRDGATQNDAVLKILAADAIEELVSRYSNQYQIPALVHPVAVLDKRGQKNFFATNIAFVLATQWGFESEQPGANWIKPSELPAAQWDRSGCLEVAIDVD